MIVSQGYDTTMIMKNQQILEALLFSLSFWYAIIFEKALSNEGDLQAWQK